MESTFDKTQQSQRSNDAMRDSSSQDSKKSGMGRVADALENPETAAATGGVLGAAGGGVAGWTAGMTQGVIVGLVAGMFLGSALCRRN